MTGTRVYKAREPFIVRHPTPGHTSNIRSGRIVTATHPAVAMYPDRWVLLGTVDVDVARWIVALDDEATVKTVPLDKIASGVTEPESLPPIRPTVTDDPRQPVASREDAIAAFAQFGSDRKAAQELGISRTQVRRLRGVDT